MRLQISGTHDGPRAIAVAAIRDAAGRLLVTSAGVDGRTYARWVVGTTGSRPLDDRWPAEGSAIRYTAGAGPLRFSGRTVVRRCEPGKLLELEARKPRV